MKARALRYIIAATVLALLGAPVLVSAGDNAMTSDAGRPDAARDASNGRLPPEVIQRIVRTNFGRFKLCYERGLRDNPRLGGRVATKFVIDRTGHVSQAGDDGTSDLPDPKVRKCVADAMMTIEFPPPEGGGVVTVVYPLIFAPGDQQADVDAGARDAAKE